MGLEEKRLKDVGKRVELDGCFLLAFADILGLDFGRQDLSERGGVSVVSWHSLVLMVAVGWLVYSGVSIVCMLHLSGWHLKFSLLASQKIPATYINLFNDFEKSYLLQMKAWAENFWIKADAELAATDGQSTIYTHKAFAKFIFGSIVPSLQKLIQNLIMDPWLWNNGPYVWAIMVYHFFPFPITLKTTVLHKMKTLTLAEHKNDLKSYCTDLINMNTVVDTTTNTEELVMAFLTQINQHPSDIVHNHFNQIGVKFYMHPDERPLITKLLESANPLHNITMSPSLPFTASSN